MISVFKFCWRSKYVSKVNWSFGKFVWSKWWDSYYPCQKQQSPSCGFTKIINEIEVTVRKKKNRKHRRIKAVKRYYNLPQLLFDYAHWWNMFMESFELSIVFIKFGITLPRQPRRKTIRWRFTRVPQ